MFSTSSQGKHWMFKDEQELANCRLEASRKFVQKHGVEMTQEMREKFFLSPVEERMLIKQYENHLREFCRKFQPPMPRSVTATSFHYFKRFYLHNSVMDYHPKEILVTCVYLACKVEEFNVSISQFVANIKGDREKASDIILNNELLLMQQLHYHLTVHNPYRPVEGLLIDIKTRCTSLRNPEWLRQSIDDFLDQVFFTDAFLIYAPSQIALAAILHAASRQQENLDAYVTDTLFGTSGKDKLPNLIEAVRKVRVMVKAIEQPHRDNVKYIEKKLEKCRNQENNPDSQIYKRKLQELLEDEEDRQSEKYAKIAEEHRRAEEALLGSDSKVLTTPGS